MSVRENFITVCPQWDVHCWCFWSLPSLWVCLINNCLSQLYCKRLYNSCGFYNNCVYLKLRVTLLWFSYVSIISVFLVERSPFFLIDELIFLLWFEILLWGSGNLTYLIKLYIVMKLQIQTIFFYNNNGLIGFTLLRLNTFFVCYWEIA